MMFHENCLPADDSHEISCLFLLFLEKAAKFEMKTGVTVLACSQCMQKS